MRFICRTLCAFVLLGAVTACNMSSPPSDQPYTPTPTAASAAPTQAGAQAIRDLQNGIKRTAVAAPFESLVALLPEIGGWQKGKPRGERYEIGMPMSRAQVAYTKDDHEIDLEILDSSFNEMALAPISMYLLPNYSQSSAEGYQKGITLRGHPGWEEWDIQPKRGKVGIVVGKRFIVSASGTDLESISPVRVVVSAVDFTKLAAIK